MKSTSPNNRYETLAHLLIYSDKVLQNQKFAANAQYSEPRTCKIRLGRGKNLSNLLLAFSLQITPVKDIIYLREKSSFGCLFSCISLLQCRTPSHYLFFVLLKLLIVGTLKCQCCNVCESALSQPNFSIGSHCGLSNFG